MAYRSISEFIQVLKERLADPDAPSFDEVRERKQELGLSLVHHWYYDDRKKWTWWLNFALVIVPLVLLVTLLDRSRMLELLVVGLLIGYFATYLDVVGSAFAVWSYPDVLLPNIPRLLPIDYVILPVTYMLIYQCYPGWAEYSVAMVVLSTVFSFVAEPLMVALNLYKLHAWRYHYSWPIYILLGLAVKWIAMFLAVQQLN